MFNSPFTFPAVSKETIDRINKLNRERAEVMQDMHKNFKHLSLFVLVVSFTSLLLLSKVWLLRGDDVIQLIFWLSLIMTG